MHQKFGFHLSGVPVACAAGGGGGGAAAAEVLVAALVARRPAVATCRSLDDWPLERREARSFCERTAAVMRCFVVSGKNRSYQPSCGMHSPRHSSPMWCAG